MPSAVATLAKQMEAQLAVAPSETRTAPARARRLTATHARGPLKRWMVAFARECALTTERLTLDAKKGMIATLARVPKDKVSSAFVKALTQREDFTEAVNGFEASALAAVRDAFDSDNIPTAIRVHAKALREAEARLDHDAADFDLRQVPALVAPAIERVAPRKADGASVAQQIVIQLAPQQAARVDAPTITVDTVEVLDATVDGLPDDGGPSGA